MVSRRAFLVGTATALTSPILAARGPDLRRQGGLGQFMVSSAICTDKTKLTPAAPDDAGFRPGAPERKMLVDRMAGNPVVLTGGVAGLACGRIAGARVDFWHADSKGAVDGTGFRFRGYQLTDAKGEFQLITAWPGAQAGRAPRIGTRIVVPGKATLTTELFFPDNPRNANDPRFKPELVMQSRTMPDGQRQFSFEFFLDL